MFVRHDQSTQSLIHGFTARFAHSLVQMIVSSILLCNIIPKIARTTSPFRRRILVILVLFKVWQDFRIKIFPHFLPLLSIFELHKIRRLPVLYFFKVRFQTDCNLVIIHVFPQLAFHALHQCMALQILQLLAFILFIIVNHRHHFFGLDHSISFSLLFVPHLLRNNIHRNGCQQRSRWRQSVKAEQIHFKMHRFLLFLFLLRGLGLCILLSTRQCLVFLCKAATTDYMRRIIVRGTIRTFPAALLVAVVAATAVCLTDSNVFLTETLTAKNVCFVVIFAADTLPIFGWSW
mmetsp:Transcript_51154/g.81489  ORF Transcript_51154/g.81489 Transcript_51154/m.81489 type:complete len:290 (+) Transcript_51154:175-1044(+)